MRRDGKHQLISVKKLAFALPLTAQNAPSGFNATVGAIVPSTLKIEPVSNKLASAVPAVKAYDFAMVKGKLLIVNPSDKKIVEVITG